jgi:hypothetical protein
MAVTNVQSLCQDDCSGANIAVHSSFRQSAPRVREVRTLFVDLDGEIRKHGVEVRAVVPHETREHQEEEWEDDAWDMGSHPGLL